MKRKILLFTGLAFFLLAGLAIGAGLPVILFRILLAIGISFKLFFLFLTFRAPGFKMSLGMYLILLGVAMILSSLLFKTIYPQPIIGNILFYTAITLKLTGVGLLFYKAKH